ncbi:polysaccharide deacetylase family protein [Negadavirga shengliensis]|uniref:Polysaccharide deacetylase family protein n=1 Tax=Negadavirga shengliensis TaxID=1389218 RepID=A0ABV9T302_9BACT
MKKLIFRLLRISGLPVLVREFIQKNKVTVLVFHDIDVETAEKTFSYLSRNYNFISLNRFLEACRKKDNHMLPPKAMVITFDDGHMRNYQLLPVFKKYKVPATIFLCSGIVNTLRHYWFRHDKEKIPDQALKKIPNKDRIAFLREVGFETEKEYDNPQALSKAQILDMMPFVDMQAHTVFHPILTQCDDEEAKNEIVQSKTELETDYGIKINGIAYPNGNYSEREIHIAKEAGFTCGLTVEAGFNSIESDLFRIKRLDTNDTGDFNELVVKSSGLLSLFKFPTLLK